MLPITQAEQWRHNWLSSSCCRYSPFPASSSFVNSLKLSFIFTLTDIFLCSGHPSFFGLAVLLYSLLHIQLLLLKYFFFFFCTAKASHSFLLAFTFVSLSFSPSSHSCLVFTLLSFNFNTSLPPNTGFLSTPLFSKSFSPIIWLPLEDTMQSFTVTFLRACCQNALSDCMLLGEVY